MMRILFLILFFCLAADASAQTTKTAPTADAVLNPVLQKAKASGKNVLLIFHASWCGWCRKMDTSLNDATVKPLIDKNYEVVHLTVYELQHKKYLENPGALAFLQENGGADEGLPYWYILRGDRKVLASSERAPGENTGCPATEEEVGYFLKVLKETSSLTDAELELVRIRFRKNEN